MKKKMFPGALSLLLSLGLSASLISPAIPARAASENSPVSDETISVSGEEDYVEGEVIVTLATPKRTTLAKEGIVSFDDEMTVEESWNFGDAKVLAETKEQENYLDDKRFYVSEISSDTYSTEKLMEKLSNQAYVVSVEPNYYRKKMSMTSDTFSDQQWYLGNSDAYKSESEGIRYQQGKADSDQIPVVAVVDTGIDYTHEDLKDHMWKNTYSDLKGSCGYDFGDNDADPMDEDSDGHGTHCAGVIGAVTDNQTGIAGVSSDVRLMALKIFDSRDDAADSSIIAAFNYIYKAQQLGVNVTAVNCSWGGGSSSQTMQSLVNKIGAQGALFLFASGNDSTNQDMVSSMRKECPYDMSSEYVVIVGASDLEDKAASFSNYGSESVDIFAPGVQIFSTVNHANFIPAAYSEEQRNTLTSLFSDGTVGSVTLCTPSDLDLVSRQALLYGTIEHSSEDFYGNSDNGSYFVPFSALSKRDATLYVYMDVTGLSLDPSQTYYTASDLSLQSSSLFVAEERDWTHYTKKTRASDFVTQDGKTYLRILNLTTTLRSYSGIYLDNIAISCANPDTASFGKYDYMEGTSMAAPIVSGAVAALSGLYPSDSVSRRKERLFSCVRKVSDLANKCKTGGILDMSLFATTEAPAETAAPSDTGDDSSSSSGVGDISENTDLPLSDDGDISESTDLPSSDEGNLSENTDLPSSDEDDISDNTVPSSPVSSKVAVKKITLNKKTAKLRYKKKLKLKATVSPSNATNKNVKWSVSKAKYAKVTQKGVVTAKKKGIGHTVKVYAVSKADSSKKVFCKVKIRA